jgi:hypothetical protein
MISFTSSRLCAFSASAASTKSFCPITRFSPSRKAACFPRIQEEKFGKEAHRKNSYVGSTPPTKKSIAPWPAFAKLFPGNMVGWVHPETHRTEKFRVYYIRKRSRGIEAN